MSEKNLYGLLGYPLSHSFSKPYFTKKFDDLKIMDAEYQNFEEADLFFFMAKAIKMKNLVGFNVTIPFKEGIIQTLDSISDEASYIGAVNTVKKVDGKFLGYNTDVIGFRNSIEPLLKKHQYKALILGTGGASKAVKYVFDQLSIASIFVSRYSVRGHITYDQISENMLQNYPIIVNTTPLGTYPNVDSAPDIPYHAITDKHLCFDLVYNPEETKFLRLAKKQGATIMNGYDMLVGQAEASWAIWRENV